VVEAITPLIGWAAGFAASSYISAVDHWIAFALLGAVGMNMLYSAVRGADVEEAGEKNSSFLLLLATAVGTSLDAMAVGVSLAFSMSISWLSRWRSDSRRSLFHPAVC